MLLLDFSCAKVRAFSDEEASFGRCAQVEFEVFEVRFVVLFRVPSNVRNSSYVSATSSDASIDEKGVIHKGSRAVRRALADPGSYLGWGWEEMR